MKKILSTLFALVACVSLSFAAVQSGSCGDNLTWSLEVVPGLPNYGVLYISGTGDMSYTGNAPWYSWRTKVEQVEFEQGITSIADNAFVQCTFTSITIPSSVTTIGNYAFQGNTALESIEIPSTVASIGTSSFKNCTSLRELSIECPVADYAFYGCSSLETVTLGTGVTSIGARGFSDCSALKFIELPPTLTFIGAAAFKGCSEFIRVICNATTPPDLAGSIFADVCPNYSIFVPAGTKTIYTTYPSKWRGVGFDGHVFDHPYAYTFEDAINQDYTTTLETLNDGSVIDITFSGRAFLRNGDYNTICFPFNLSAEQLADETNPLYNFSIYEITGMYIAGTFVKLQVDKVSEIVAGQPYLMKYNGEEANLVNPKFSYVSVATITEGEKDVEGVTMKGILKPTALEAGNKLMLFLLAGNQLAWAAAGEGNNIMKGFRGYFVFDSATTPAGLPLRSLSAHIVEHEEVTTGIEDVQNNEVKATKVIENGNLYIIKNGVQYNIQGQVISK